VTLFLVLLMALTSVATEGGMGDTTSMAIVSARDILELAMPSADSMEVDFTAVAATGRREEEMTEPTVDDVYGFGGPGRPPLPRSPM
jgi:hypothetical protein